MPETTTPNPSPLLQTLHTQGYIIIRSLLTPLELSALRTATANLTVLARAGQWPHIRTVGKQFPPWPSTPPADGSGIWGVQHLLHPALPISPADRAAFARLYFSPKILGVAQELLQASSPDDLVMELFNLLVRPETPFQLRWHRDDVPPTATTEEEEARLVRADGPRYGHTQWNMPLYDDDSLVLVPGSHRRARTEQERSAGPYEEGLEGEVRVLLGAGDVAFYDNDILHRGVYGVERERMTLHGSVGLRGGSVARARNVLQHGVGSWVDGCDFGELLKGDGEEEREMRRVAEGMRERLVEMGRVSGDVGYSLDG